MRKIKNIFIHCSGTPWGDVLIFSKWHRRRGWKGIGYHFVILNGRPKPDVEYWDFLDGVIQPGRALDDDPIFERNEIGAHVAGRNLTSLGICLVGRKEFTDLQFISLRRLCLRLIEHFNLKTEDILGHYEDPNTYKTCPNIPMDALRGYLDGKIELSELQQKIKEHVKRLR
jgi:hypothetical protein